MKNLKGQSAVEFIILVSALVFFFLVFLYGLQLNVADRNQENKNALVYEVALQVQNELDLASKSVNGYYRNFSLPLRIGNSEYDVDASSGAIYIHTEDGKYALSLPVPNLIGDLNDPDTPAEGITNVIRKENNRLCLNTPIEDCGVCGDNNIDAPVEQCDDNNTISGDGCSYPACQQESVCNGDGDIDPGEECDDGDSNNNNDCTNACTNAECNDGIIWNQGAGTEQCDGGNFCDNTCNNRFLVFVSSYSDDGVMGGLAGADATCDSAASTAGLPQGNWKAWMSSSTENAITRLADAPTASYSYELSDGTVVANDWADLTDGSLDNAISRDQNNASVNANVWTGSSALGVTTARHCVSWTSNLVGQLGTTGSSISTTGTWSNIASPTCNTNTPRVYCIQRRV